MSECWEPLGVDLCFRGLEKCKHEQQVKTLVQQEFHGRHTQLLCQYFTLSAAPWSDAPVRPFRGSPSVD